MNLPEADDPTESTLALRSFYAAGIAWQTCVQGYWLLFFVRVAIDLDFSPLQLVMLGTAKEVAVLTMEIPTGIVADFYSRKWSVVIAFFVAGLAIVASGTFDSFGLLLAASALWGVGLTFRSGAEIAWFTSEIGSTKIVEHIVMKRSSVEMAAIVTGVIGATLLSVLTSNGTALAAFGIVLMIAGGVLAAAMPETAFQRIVGSKRLALGSIVNDGLRAARRVPPLRTLIVATVLAGFASEAIDRLYVRRFDDIGLTDRFDNEVILLAIVVIGQALIALVALRWARRTIAVRSHPEVLARTLAALLATTAIGAAMLALVDALAVAALGLVAAGAMRASTEPVKAAWANEYAPPASRATVQSFVGQAQSLGEIGGGVALGIVATVIGVPAALTVSATTYLAAAAVIAQFRRRNDDAKSCSAAL